MTSVAAAREHARRATGQFGTQSHSDSGLVDVTPARIERRHELVDALTRYDTDRNLRQYVDTVVEILGYTQRNGFASKILVSPGGTEFEIPPEVGRNRTEAGQTMKILAMRLMSEGRMKQSTKDFSAFLGEDGGWFTAPTPLLRGSGPAGAPDIT